MQIKSHTVYYAAKQAAIRIVLYIIHFFPFTVPPPQATVTPSNDNANVSYFLDPNVEVSYITYTATNSETGEKITNDHPIPQKTTGQFNIPGLTSGTPYTLTTTSVAPDGRMSESSTTNFRTSNTQFTQFTLEVIFLINQKRFSCFGRLEFLYLRFLNLRNFAFTP